MFLNALFRLSAVAQYRGHRYRLQGCFNVSILGCLDKHAPESVYDQWLRNTIKAAFDKGHSVKRRP
jgi:hypothetical protein